MFERILVPLDGSRLAEAILPQVSILARRSRGEVLLLRSYPSQFHPRMDNVRLEVERRGEAETYIRLMEMYVRSEGLVTRGLVRSGPPAETILETAEEEGASLIALITHGRSGIARWVLGSVAEEILRASLLPVLVARSLVAASALPEGPPFRTILLPIDGSEVALSIVAPIAAFARRFGSQVVVLHVADRNCDKAHATEVLQPVTASLAAEGVEGIVSTRRGDPASEILEACSRYSADLIAMSTHGRRGPSRWAFGSVTEKVLRAARVPMLVTRGSWIPRHPVEAPSMRERV